MVPVVVVEMTAQFATGEGSQIATSIDEKLCLGSIVFPREAWRNAVLRTRRVLMGCTRVALS